MQQPVSKSQNEGGLSFDVGTDDIQPTSAESKPASVEIEADALTPGIRCPFTDGCTGTVRIIPGTDIKRTTEENGKIVQTQMQQYHCQKCKMVAKGFKIVSKNGVRKFFNRVTGKAEG
jgi:hypothetical protein